MNDPTPQQTLADLQSDSTYAGALDTPVGRVVAAFIEFATAYPQASQDVEFTDLGQKITDCLQRIVNQADPAWLAQQAADQDVPPAPPAPPAPPTPVDPPVSHDRIEGGSTGPMEPKS